MVNFNGAYQPNPLTHQFAGRSSNIDDYNAPPVLFGVDIGQLPHSGGTLTDTQPIDEPKIAKGAPSSTEKEFGQDWYNHIHVIPLNLSLGNILSSQQRTVEVWNAYFVNKLLNSISGANVQGISLTEPQTAPTTFGPLESRIYTVSVSTSGPGSVNGTYMFDFPDEDPVLAITGTRVVIFPFGPNYRTKFREAYEFSTDLLLSKNARTENRISRREFPRRVFEFEIAVTETLIGLLDTYLWEWQSNLFAVPFWPDVMKLTQDVSLGGTVLNVVTTDNTDIHNGGSIILWLNEREVEAVEVLSFTQTQITLVNGVQRLYLAGTALVPSRLGRLQDQTTVRNLLPQIHNDIGLRFQIEESDQTPGVDSVEQYRSNPIYERQPQWASNVSNEYRRMRETLDNLSGVLVVEDIHGRGFFVHQYHHVFQNRQEIYDFKKWLIARKGRQKGIWMATWNRDMTLFKTIAASDANIDIYNIGYNTFIEQDIGRRDIEIRLKDGTVFRRRIDSSSPLDAQSERIGITTSLGQQVDPEDVEQIQYLMFVRLNSDNIEILWETPEIARATFSARVLTDDV